MKKILATLLLTTISIKTIAMEETLLDIINGIWAADQYNQLCPEDPIKLPATEAEITQSLIEATGQDFVGELAKTLFIGEVTLRDHAKAIVESYLKEGCSTEMQSRNAQKSNKILLNTVKFSR